MERISAWTDLVQPNGRFRYGSMAAGQAPTPIKAEWLNMLQAELVNFILEYLPALDQVDDQQLLKAAQKMIANLAVKATTLAGYGILDAYTKAQADYLLSQKANWAISLAGYGITDAYTKAEVYTAPQVDALLSAKADNGTTLEEYGIADAYTQNQADYLLSQKANWAISLAGYGITDAYTKIEITEQLALKANKSTGSLGASGWHLDSSTGRLEVWGTVSLVVGASVGDRTDQVVVFPKAFDIEAFNVSFSNCGGDSSEIVETVIGFGELTKTGMKVSVRRLSGTQTGEEATIVHYRVIGH